MKLSYARQWINEKDIDSVVRVLGSDLITQGPALACFEKKIADLCGAHYAVAVSSGTAALHLASIALGLKKGDQVITSPISFLAAPNSVLYVDAKPVFADIDPRTANLSAPAAQKMIHKNTKAIYLVHFAGLPCDMGAFAALAKKHDLFIVEDASHAIGAQYRLGGRWHRVGGCQHSDLTIFSFHPVKHVTTGEGGAITTNDPKLYESLMLLRNHGMFRSEALSIQHGPWHYEMRELGFNYRMTDIQAALGESQLDRLKAFVTRRRKIAAHYNRAFARIPGLEIIHEPKDRRGSYHLYPIKIDFKKIGMGRAEFMKRLSERGVGSQVHYIPIYKQPYYQAQGYSQVYLKEAERYFESALSLPLYPKMTDTDVENVVHAVKDVLKGAKTR